MQSVQFPLYDDAQIGLQQAWLQNSLMELGQDDDQDTDEEIQDYAIKTCQSEYKKGFTMLKSSKNLKKLIANMDIQKRVQFPELYDYDGKLIS